MSDDEDCMIVQPKKSRQIHYGSLEEQEKARLAALAAAAKEGAEEPTKTGKEFGDIQISSEYMDLEDEVSRDKKALLEEFERRRKARQLNVSTDDDEVRRSLRQLGEPVCLFGEGPAERRVRLRDLLSYLGEDAIHKKLEEEEARIERERDREGTWYHEGPSELKAARLWIAQYSLRRAKERLQKDREELQLPGSARAAARQEAHRRAAAMSIYCSQIGDTRPISFCRFSDDSKMLITSSWSGLVKVWSVPGCAPLLTLRGHRCNVSAAVFRPGVTMPEHFEAMTANAKEKDDDAKMNVVVAQSDVVAMASCSYDGDVLLWNFSSDAPIKSLEGHGPERVSRVAFHPSGRFLGVACYDHSWRLWDLQIGKEVLHQEGHAKPVHCIAFQEDGSLVVTGGTDAFGRVWDLRTGRCVMLLSGHRGALLGADWARGRRVATAAADHTVRLWDLRTRAAVYALPAHSHLVSDVRYQRGGGHVLLSCSYDRTARLWAEPACRPLRTLSTHDNKVMSADMSPDSKYIATSSYDRSFRLWTPDMT